MRPRIDTYNSFFKFSLFAFLIVFMIGCKNKPENSSKLFEDSFFSKYLNEDRVLTLYFPDNFDVKKAYDIVYATDGQIIDKEYKLKLDELISKEEIAPVIIVGVNSNEKEVKGTGLQYRNFEYVKNQSIAPDLSQLYQKHYLFFTEEVINYMHEKYNVITGKKVFYGFSNGAGFGFNLMCDTSSMFDYYFLYSILGADKSLVGNIHGAKSEVYISYGSEEPLPLLEGMKTIEKEFKDKNYPYHVNVFHGGHSRKFWKKEFFSNLKQLKL